MSKSCQHNAFRKCSACAACSTQTPGSVRQAARRARQRRAHLSCTHRSILRSPQGTRYSQSLSACAPIRPCGPFALALRSERASSP